MSDTLQKNLDTEIAVLKQTVEDVKQRCSERLLASSRLSEEFLELSGRTVTLEGLADRSNQRLNGIEMKLDSIGKWLQALLGAVIITMLGVLANFLTGRIK